MVLFMEPVMLIVAEVGGVESMAEFAMGVNIRNSVMRSVVAVLNWLSFIFHHRSCLPIYDVLRYKNILYRGYAAMLNAGLNFSAAQPLKHA